MAERKPLVAGNWKMNGSKLLAKQFVSQLTSLETVDVLICPPFPFLACFDKAAFLLGAQTCSNFESGAYTGDVSSEMLTDSGCQYVVVGHSERRVGYQESNQDIAQKVLKVLDNNMTPLVCCGEDLAVRESGALFQFIEQQLSAVFSQLNTEQLVKVVIAYEPIWAIGTGKTASPAQAQEVHAFIRGCLAKFSQEAAQKVRILYGGSVNSSNAAELFSQKDIDGGLVGGASLDVNEFIKICQCAED